MIFFVQRSPKKPRMLARQSRPRNSRTLNALRERSGSSSKIPASANGTAIFPTQSRRTSRAERHTASTSPALRQPPQDGPSGHSADRNPTVALQLGTQSAPTETCRIRVGRSQRAPFHLAHCCPESIPHPWRRTKRPLRFASDSAALPRGLCAPSSSWSARRPSTSLSASLDTPLRGYSGCSSGCTLPGLAETLRSSTGSTNP